MGQLTRFGTSNQVLPEEGPIVIPYVLDFTNGVSVDVDLTIPIMNNIISFVQGFYLDNRNNPNVTTVTIQGTNQVLSIPGGREAYLPALFTGDALCTVTTTQGVILPFFVTNVPVVPFIWDSGSGVVTSGTATAANQVLEIAQLTALNTKFTNLNTVAGAADAGNGLKISGVFNTALPSLTNGQKGDLQLATTGVMLVTPTAASGAVLSSAGNTSDGVATSASTTRQNTNSLGYYYNGSTMDRARGDLNGVVNQPFAMAGNRFSYAAPATGVNAAASTTIIAAAGAGVRNYLQSFDIRTGLTTAAAELTITDGTGGTVLWRTTLPVGTTSFTKNFELPLRGSANTLMAYALSAIPGVGVYFNGQGYQSTI